MKSVGDRFAKSSLRFAFLLMGFSFSVMQTLMARELLVSFAGNELSIGLVLGSWLILEAVGSGLAARLAERVRGGASTYASLQVALSLLLPLSVYAAFTVRRIVGITPGEGTGLVPTFCSAFLVLLPLGLVDRAMFTFGCRVYAKETSSIGHVYVLEAIGEPLLHQRVLPVGVGHSERGRGGGFSITACWLLFPVVLTILYAQAGRPGVSAAIGPILLILNALAGFLVGMEFPLASRMYRCHQPANALMPF